MRGDFIRFDSVYQRVETILASMDLTPLQGIDVYLVRDLYGRVRIIADEPASDSVQGALGELATRLSRELGAHGHPPDASLLILDTPASTLLGSSARRMSGCMFWVDRMITGNGWQTVNAPASRRNRYTLFSVNGGVGRSTTAVVLAWHLAHQGERVLVVDADVESPGLGSTVLDQGAHPEFGIVDWFVEDLVGQAAHVLDRMVGTPTWAQDLEGSVAVVPAHGRRPGEYLAKLGRVYLNTRLPWTERLDRVITSLEEAWQPSIVVIESRSGLHDLAAAAVTDVGAHVMLFATDSASTWSTYEMVFSHWRDHRLAEKMRDRLSIVSALTPETGTDQYLARFTERSWHLFRDYLYDGVEPSFPNDAFSFDLRESPAPHSPLAIHWNRGLAAGSSLHRIDAAPVTLAYSAFLRSFDSYLRPATTR